MKCPIISVDQADAYLGRVAGLPPAPIAATQLLDLFDEPEQDIDQVVQLLDRWGLPEHIVSAVQQHHTTESLESAPNERLVVPLKLANNLAHLISLENAQICDPSKCIPAGINVLGLTADDIPHLVEQTEDRVRCAQRFSKLFFDQPARSLTTRNTPT